jgi:hypothetical protein
MTDSAPNAAASCRVVTTIFRHVKAPEPDHVRDWTWAELVEFFERNGHERVEDKEDCYLFGNYSLKEGTRSKNANVEQVFCWALDLDKMSQAKIDAVLERLIEDELAFICYSTFQHTEVKPRFRIVGPLAQPVAGKDWPGVWRAIVDKYCPGADEQCKDVRRLYYFPCARPGASTALYDSPGRALEPPAPKAAQKAASTSVDLDSREVVEFGVKVPRCPTGSNPFEYAEHLCRTMPPAIEGQQGSIALFRVARALVWGLQLDQEQANDLIEELYNPRCSPAWSASEIAHKVSDASVESGASYRSGDLLPLPAESYDGLAPIVQSNGRFWVRMPNTNDYSRRCAKDDLPIVIRKHWPAGTHVMYDEPEELPKPADLAKWSEAANTIVTCYYSDLTTFDPSTEILRQGLRYDPEIKPAFDADVEALLTAYAGAQLDDLKRWIAAARSDRLKAPARALAVVGKKGLGKTLFALALARCWGAPVVPASVLCARFNGALEHCPIVLADERLPEDLTGEAFREVIAAREHSIEPKGRERQTLYGCIRMVVTANDLGKLHLLGGKGRDDVDAIADRFFLIHVPDDRAAACYDAQRPLLGADGSTIDVTRMARHFRHIQATVEPAAGRFIGSLGDGGALAVTLAAETERAPEIFDVVRSFLLEGWGAEYKPSSAGIPRRGEVVPEAKRNAPLVVRDGRLFVRVPALGQLVGREQREVAAALRPFVLAKRDAFTLGGLTFDVAELDPAALIQSLDVDFDAVAPTLMIDTADRHPTGPT